MPVPNPIVKIVAAITFRSPIQGREAAKPASHVRQFRPEKLS
jgi:hypothetical protein